MHQPPGHISWEIWPGGQIANEKYVPPPFENPNPNFLRGGHISQEECLQKGQISQKICPRGHFKGGGAYFLGHRLEFNPIENILIWLTVHVHHPNRSYLTTDSQLAEQSSSATNTLVSISASLMNDNICSGYFNIVPHVYKTVVTLS